MHPVHRTDEDTKAWRWRELSEATAWGELQYSAPPTQSLCTHSGRCPLFPFDPANVYPLFKIQWKPFFWEDLPRDLLWFLWDVLVPPITISTTLEWTIPFLVRLSPLDRDLWGKGTWRQSVAQEGVGIFSAQDRRWCGTTYRAQN